AASSTRRRRAIERGVREGCARWRRVGRARPHGRKPRSSRTLSGPSDERERARGGAFQARSDLFSADWMRDVVREAAFGCTTPLLAAFASATAAAFTWASASG